MSIEKGQVLTKTAGATLEPTKWVDNYADFLFRYAIVRVNNNELAKDLLQETFFSALKSMSNFKGESSERTWLVAILKHKIVDYYRKEAAIISKAFVETQIEIETSFFEDDTGHWKAENRPSAFNPILDKLQEKEFNGVLKQCLDKMPSLWSAVFTMKHVDEEQTDVILKALRITSSNFWVIIHRSKLSLRACLQKNWL